MTDLWIMGWLWVSKKKKKKDMQNGWKGGGVRSTVTLQLEEFWL